MFAIVLSASTAASTAVGCSALNDGVCNGEVSNNGYCELTTCKEVTCSGFGDSECVDGNDGKCKWESAYCAVVTDGTDVCSEQDVTSCPNAVSSAGYCIFDCKEVKCSEFGDAVTCVAGGNDGKCKWGSDCTVVTDGNDVCSAQGATSCPNAVSSAGYCIVDCVEVKCSGFGDSDCVAGGNDGKCKWESDCTVVTEGTEVCSEQDAVSCPDKVSFAGYCIAADCEEVLCKDVDELYCTKTPCDFDGVACVLENTLTACENWLASDECAADQNLYCTWDSGCKPTADGCVAYDELHCRDAGCTWSSAGGGVCLDPVVCSDNATSATCAEAPGCTWNSDDNTCEGDSSGSANRYVAGGLLLATLISLF